MFFFIKGSSYGGIRHLLSIYPLMAVSASLMVYIAIIGRSYLLRAVATVGVVAALVLAVPVMRPWEYFNEIAGGSENAHKYFDGEGLDLYQRNNEIRTYYHEVLKPQGDVPFVFYLTPDVKDTSRMFDEVRASSEKWSGDTDTGTFMIGANEMAPAFFFDKKAFRDAEPIARFGNLFVFRGTFDIRPLKAQSLEYRAAFQIYGQEPDIEKAIEMLTESVKLDPKAFFVSLELGNQHLKLGNRADALHAYQLSLENVPAGDAATELLTRQIERVKNDPLETILPLRNPAME
jgi:tetratricopeptide (TPR) repeat protein